ncbi:hypothetical protein HRG_006083 [Hirsutella rhossiliensis]|uniref:Uncharacterized protein n=1 Tax=Hirsutella rhossiliensis TaxID=111463 RepID=A0A9P8SHW6_9HYPO|nr:uncharacterized protein HRG_06083 [Hirsutella rhossiliensis]KAH0963573.1 hypothetical protein HRG_06083 [Hirsutella rhossiliensis]
MRDFTSESGPLSSDADDFGTASQPAIPLTWPVLPGPAVSRAVASLWGFGYSESLPPIEVQEELNHAFLNVQYQFILVIHAGRYYQPFYRGPLQKPPMCLQYAIWAMTATGPSKYNRYSQVFYQRTRQYAEADEMMGHGEYFITVAHAQARAIITS